MKSSQSEVEQMPSAFAVWLEQPVVLKISAGDLRVPLKGRIVGETEDAIRFRVGEGWDVDIFKSMILAVEQDQLEDNIT
jgi:hypothetical protein